MSYILDALKKSERERKKGEVPNLNSFDNSPPPPRSTKRSVILLLLAILIVSIAGINLWVLFRQSPDTTAQDEPVAVTASQEMADSAGDADIPEPVDQPAMNTDQATKTPETEAREPTAPNVTEKMTAAITGAEQAIPATEVLQPEKPAIETTVASDEQGGDEPVEATEGSDLEFAGQPFDEAGEDDKKITIAYADLPNNIRDAMPELSIAAHYYSANPKARMASINGRIMRQGQKLEKGLVLEEINEDGVIFSFNKYRFSLKVFNP